MFQETTNLKGCYLTAKAVYESGDDHEAALLILDSGAAIVEKATRDLEKGRSVIGKEVSTLLITLSPSSLAV
jgi:hypothetical protein